MTAFEKIPISKAGQQGMKLFQAKIAGNIFCEFGVSLGDVNVHGPIYIGRHTYMVSGHIKDHVEIGRYCSIGREVIVGTGIHDTSGFSTSPFLEHLNDNVGYQFAQENPLRRTVIGNDVWIGDRAYIMSGVKIGDGAIIGAGAVVTKSVEEFAIVGGVPARKIRHRFSEDIVTRILDSKWWNRDSADLKSIEKADIEGVLEQVEGMTGEEEEKFFEIVVSE